MSGVGGPMPCAVATGTLIELPLEIIADPVVTRGGARFDCDAVGRRIGAIVAQCQKEAHEEAVPLSSIELRLALLAEDVRGGLYGGID